jgi:hypothetical protein
MIGGITSPDSGEVLRSGVQRHGGAFRWGRWLTKTLTIPHVEKVL